MIGDFQYCNSLAQYARFVSREVSIGNIAMGGNNPIRIQSMTNTHTMDTAATIEQCIRIADAGADYVRITAPGIQDAENLAHIKAGLRKAGYSTPLIADIHFNPQAAEVAARIVEKVRINPGNYADKKRFAQLTLTDAEYALELEKIHSKLLPLLTICKTYGTAIRIGVNHGSLSDRIMSRYGDTPQGMVASAMEFVRICNTEGFHNIVLSLKASNTRIMVQAYRLLAHTMLTEHMNYPLHLGVTEAGDSEDGRIRSAVGMGTLLADGIGDTIRVSLTEEPEAEIPVAKALVSYFKGRENTAIHTDIDSNLKNPFEYSKRESIAVRNIGSNNQPIVVTDFTNTFEAAQIAQPLPDYFYLKAGSPIQNRPLAHNYILNLHDWFKFARDEKNIFPLYTDAEFIFYGTKHPELNFVIVSQQEANDKIFSALEGKNNVVLILETFSQNGVAEQRAFIYQLMSRSVNIPVIINRNYAEDEGLPFQIKAASDAGLLFIDGIGDGLWLRNAGHLGTNRLLSASFGILQASRVRTTKTEYISCPSCGRTMFDLQTVTSQIKQRTSHLKHLKIGIMGCIVNGPGEMADADYGYVGAAAGKVTLYKNKNVIRKNIPSEQAVDALIELIKDCGDWKPEE